MSTAQHTQELRLKARKARNPYRIPEKRKQFDAMVSDYMVGRPFLFHKAGTENRLNNIGEAFWRGWHGERFIWHTDAPIHVAYKAGAAIAKATGSAA